MLEHGFALSVDNHIALVRELLIAVQRDVRPRRILLAGFSSGADIIMRLVAEGDATTPRVDGILSLGCNLALETCFVTRVFMQLGQEDEAAILDALRQFTADATTLESWLNVHEYLVTTLRKFGRQLEPVRRFSDDMVRYFDADDAFPALFRAVTSRVARVRCVREDSELCRRLINDLRLRNLDDPHVLGEHYTEETLAIEEGLGHFDLKRPALIRRHLDEMLAASGRESIS